MNEVTAKQAAEHIVANIGERARSLGTLKDPVAVKAATFLTILAELGEAALDTWDAIEVAERDGTELNPLNEGTAK